MVDSTRIKMLSEGKWATKKHGLDFHHHWRKVHLGIDATLKIWAGEVTDNATGDAPMLQCLLEQTPDHEILARVSGDGAYDTKSCHEPICESDHPNAQEMLSHGNNSLSAAARNAILVAARRLGLKIWKKWIGYHRRSLVETTMRCFKLLGELVMRVT